MRCGTVLSESLADPCLLGKEGILAAAHALSHVSPSQTSPTKSGELSIYPSVYLSIHLIHTYIQNIYIYTYILVYGERERERER